MQDSNPNNKNSRLRLNEQFSEDLKVLFESDTSAGSHVDRMIMARAAQQLSVRSKHRTWYYWSTAAAVVLIAGGLLLMNFNTKQESPLPLAAHRKDIDRNGTIDILDAFALARQIESNNQLNDKWDMNGDSLVNQADVDAVALYAVRLNEGVL